MKMNKLFLIGLISLTLSCTNSCTKKEDCNYPVYNFSPVTAIEGPNSAYVGEEINIKIHSVGFNSCTATSGIKGKEVVDGNERLIEIKGVSNGCDRVCLTVLVDVVTFYKFKAPQPGVYFFKFLSYGDKYIEHQLTAQ